MRFSLTQQQSSFFTENGFIEFDAMLDPDSAKDLLVQLRQELQKRLGYSVDRCSAEQIYGAGQDLWRVNRAIYKAVRRVALSELGAELFDERPLRLAYTQCIFGGSPFRDGVTFEEMGSIQGVVGGLALCLQGDEGEAEDPEDEELIDVFSPVTGSAIYFAPDHPLSLASLKKHPDRCYLLIAYATMRPVYVRREGDPHTHSLKDYGYEFGDTLKEETHPLVFR